MVALVARVMAVAQLAGVWTKIRNIEAFRLICAGYPGATTLGVVNLATVAIAGELVFSTMILLPDPTVSRVGLAGCVFGVSAATAAIALRRWRGEKYFRCGCGTDLDTESSASWLIGRNILLLAMLATALVALDAFVPAGLGDNLALLLAVTGVVACVYLLAAAKLTWARIREWSMDI